MRIKPRLRRAMWEVHRHLCESTTVNTQQGRFTIPFDDFIGKSLYLYGEYELNLMRNVMAFLGKRGGTLIDVGANIGTASIGLLNLGACERAIAIEPEPRNYQLLRRNVAQNNLGERVVCMNYAASNRAGAVDLELSPTNTGDHRVRMVGGGKESERPTVTVPCERLDDLLAPFQDYSLLWLDVQGHEAHVLEGAAALLSTGIPVVAEMCPYLLQRAGVTPEQFCALAATHWREFYVWRRCRFMRYPIDTLPLFLDEVGCEGHHENVIFAPQTESV
jgi:FkbM family methyltransferase